MELVYPFGIVANALSMHETMPDHVHLFIKTVPTIAPNNVIARIKGRSSRILRNEFVGSREVDDYFEVTLKVTGKKS